MKKIILTLALAITSTLAFSQKTVDWSVDQILSPLELQTSSTSTTPLIWHVVLKNNGTDTVLMGDTIWIQWAITDVNNNVAFGLLYPGPNANTYGTMLAKKDMASGDTMHYRFSAVLNFGIHPSGNFKAFFKSHVINRARGLNFESTQTNNAKSDPIVWYNFQRWAVSVNSLYKNSSLAIYPNPAKDNLNINLEIIQTNSVVTVVVYDMMGKEIMTEVFNSNFENMNINTSNLNNGVYSVKVSNGNSTYTSKFVKE